MITLTYNNDHIPVGGTLIKEHFQLFMKRLRYSIQPKKIRFYHCGEYGSYDEDINKPQLESRLGRPHYHAAIFGHEFTDLELFKKKGENRIYTSEILSEIWGLCCT